ncbi:MAG: hypothetical protein PHP93_02585 [Kiritimatiellales bacterium]|nr:hypothetical protein [Kiritimatiellales bacterium]
MDISIEGSDSGSVFLMAIFMAAQLGPLVALIGSVFSVMISVLAFRKGIFWLAYTFLLLPLILVAGCIVQFLALSNMTEAYAVAMAVASISINLIMLSPYIVVFTVLQKLKPANKSRVLASDEE